ncbi:hypothetical protein HY78_07880 [Rhizorhabdus wittichii DC-6]|nr:hypothetical protein HY78_07880 [Rhizorhabdus wittichii DC-6]
MIYSGESDRTSRIGQRSGEAVSPGSRFPVEAEIDKVLRAKLRRRGGPKLAAPSLAEAVDGCTRLIAAHVGRPFEVRNPRWFHGGASKIQMAFELVWDDATSGEPPQALVLRMDPPASIVETSRLREFEILRAVRGVVPVPECHWVDPDGTHLHSPGLIYGYVPGVAKPTKHQAAQVTGVGTRFGPDLRATLGPDFVDQLAAIHRLDVAAMGEIPGFEPVAPGSNASIIRQVNWWRRVWEEDRLEDFPLVNVAAQWLVANAPRLDHVSVVHGDYRTGNFLFDEASGRITALLDWELSVLGDRHQDLSWASGRHLGHLAEDGKTFLLGGLLPLGEFFARYEESSGLSVDPKRLKYFDIFNSYIAVVHMLGTAPRVADGATHQDVVVGWLSMIGHPIAEQLRRYLAEVL